ncbi:MAG: CsgG/HfaB family protein [Gammaproteobacteria bacterium]
MRIITLAVGLLLATTLAQASEFVAYSVAKKGTSPLPENIDTIEARYLTHVKWGQYAGSQSRAAVLKAQNTSQYKGGVPVDGIDAILADVMLNSGRFRLVERNKLDQALKEQDLGASGRITGESAAHIGKVLGAQLLVQAVVTHYEPDFEGKDASGIGSVVGQAVGGTVGSLLGGVGLKSKKSMVGMNFRVIDAATSELVFTKQVESVLSKKELSLSGFGFGNSAAGGGRFAKYYKTPIGQAVIAAVNKGVYDLIKHVGSAPASGSVIKADASQVYVNLGEGVVAVGDQLKLVSKGEQLIDPDTGLPLGSMEQQVGTLKVTAVQDKFSIAQPVGAIAGQVKRGDKVVSANQAAPLQFASSWQPPK